MFKNAAYIVNLGIIFAAYFITARIGLGLDAVGGFATLVWLPSGISLAALLILGYKYWPAVFFGAFLANVSQGASIPVGIGIGIGNTLEALFATFLLRKADFRNSIDSLKDVLNLIMLAALVSTAISATIGVLSLILGKVITPAESSNTWIAWWIGDMVSDLVVAPIILVWAVRGRFNMSSKRIWEFLALTLFVLLVNLIIFGRFPNQNPNPPAIYLVFPPLIWAALRFGQKGAVTTTFAVSVIAILATARGFGPFVNSSLSQSLLALQLFIGVTSITSLILGAIAVERRRIEERKDEFISVASHELKTPITTIKGYTQILSQALEKSSNKNLLLYVSKLDGQLNRLTKLVNDLLDVSKIQSGKLELQKDKFRLDELITGVVEDAQLTSKHKIIYKKDGKIPKISADRFRISEVLINLISNAIKYSPKANKILVYSQTSHDEVKVSVEDFGIGISKKDKDKIFERFFQADTKIRQSFSGLGLGLYISSQIIRKHNGDIWVESTKGKGTTVTFTLPLRGADDYE